MIIECDHCKSKFNKKPSQIALTKSNFCSRKCFSEHNKTAETITQECGYCGKNVTRKASDIRKTKNKSGIIYCNKNCAASHKTGIRSTNWKGGNYSYRKRALREYNSSCSRCGYNEYIKVLQVHHVDHDRRNNDIENLEVLCPTCHTVEHLILYKSNRDKPKNGIHSSEG